MEGFEPPTPCLRNKYSTPELHRQVLYNLKGCNGMNKKLTIIGAVVVLVFIAFAVVDLNDQSTEYVVHEPVLLNADNLAAYLSGYELINDLPSDARIQVNFGEISYYTIGQSIEKGEIDNSDLDIYLPENYIGLIGEVGLCSAVSTAVSNKKLGVEVHLSNGKLLWKYKGLLKYRGCLG